MLFKRHSVHSYTSLASFPVSLMTGVSALPDRLKVLFKKHSVHSYTSLESVPISLMTGVLALSIWLKVTFKRLLDFS